MPPTLTDNETSVVSDEELELQQPSSSVQLTMREKLPPSRQRVSVFARIGWIVIGVYVVMNLLNLLPSNIPQEDLPEKDPFESIQIMRSVDATQVTSGTVVIFDR